MSKGIFSGCAGFLLGALKARFLLRHFRDRPITGPGIYLRSRIHLRRRDVAA